MVFSTKRLLFLPLVFLLSYCSNRGTDDKGMRVDILSKEEMIGVLTDIHLAESSLRVGKVQRMSAADSNYQKSLYLSVYEKHGVTPGQFKASMKYYTKRISELEEIYSEVISGLAEKEAELQAADSTSKKPAKLNTGDREQSPGNKKPS